MCIKITAHKPAAIYNLYSLYKNVTDNVQKVISSEGNIKK